MKSKYYRKERCSEIYNPIKDATNLKKAWEKTLEKWVLLGEGLYLNKGRSCGLCNIYTCFDCPAHKLGTSIKGNAKCVPFMHEPDLEYLFLLFIREATR